MVQYQSDTGEILEQFENGTNVQPEWYTKSTKEVKRRDGSGTRAVSQKVTVLIFRDVCIASWRQILFKSIRYKKRSNGNNTQSHRNCNENRNLILFIVCTYIVYCTKLNLIILFFINFLTHYLNLIIITAIGKIQLLSWIGDVQDRQAWDPTDGWYVPIGQFWHFENSPLLYVYAGQATKKETTFIV